jgi:hypothetical protein
MEPSGVEVGAPHFLCPVSLFSRRTTMYFTPPDKHSYLDICIRAVRDRKAFGWAKERIALDLSKHFPQEIIFLAWSAAAILDVNS